MSHVNNCARKLRKILKPYQILILESTVYPGASDDLCDIVSNKKLKAGYNFFLGYSPERENPGDKIFTKTPKIISITSKCISLIKEIYSPIVKKLVVAKNVREANYLNY